MATTLTFEGRRLHQPYNDALTVDVRIANALVRRVLIDTGSSADLLSLSCWKQLKMLDKKLQPTPSCNRRNAPGSIPRHLRILSALNFPIQSHPLKENYYRSNEQ